MPHNRVGGEAMAAPRSSIGASQHISVVTRPTNFEVNGHFYKFKYFKYFLEIFKLNFKLKLCDFIMVRGAHV